MFLVAFLALTTVGCATRPSPIPQRLPPPASGPGAAAQQPVSEVPFMALSLVGTPYAAGGGSPDTGFDCSGLVGYVYARALQVSLPRTTFALARAGAPVTDLKPGDLVFYNTLRRPFSHVGIYLGDARFVHAPTTGGAVRIENMRLDYWARRFDGARRVAF